MREHSSSGRIEIRRRETKAFQPVEARAILLAALTYGNPKTSRDRARRWVPWLCAYSGARAGEITQLRGMDVRALSLSSPMLVAEEVRR
jgi:hypothetical protein